MYHIGAAREGQEASTIIALLPSSNDVLYILVQILADSFILEVFDIVASGMTLL